MNLINAYIFGAKATVSIFIKPKPTFWTSVGLCIQRAQIHYIHIKLVTVAMSGRGPITTSRFQIFTRGESVYWYSGYSGIIRCSCITIIDWVLWKNRIIFITLTFLRERNARNMSNNCKKESNFDIGTDNLNAFSCTDGIGRHYSILSGVRTLN